MYVDMSEDEKGLRLWYRRPAECWKEALPLGNGRMGVMVYGNPWTEKMDISEITCFSGEASFENDTEGASDYFQKARNAVQSGDYPASREFLQQFIGKRLNYGTNLPMGRLVVENRHRMEDVRDYVRSLQLDSALTYMSYRTEGVRYQRMAFLSNPHQVLVIKMSADKPGSMNMSLYLEGAGNPHSVQIAENNEILLFGNAYETVHSNGKTGVAFHGRLRVLNSGGTIVSDGCKILVQGADEVMAFFATGTDFDGSDPVEECRSRIEEAAGSSYDDLLNAHVKDFKKLFHRVQLHLGHDLDPGVPTDLILKQIREGSDYPALTALLFQFGRYLLIAGSRENSPLPAHLQGVWNDSVACRLGWTCDMHLDINTQMNYWPSESTNLAECSQPLFQWIEKKLVPSGRLTADKSYGLRGWVAELVSNAWGFTAPYWHTNISPCPSGGVWVATHLWEHYQFSGDTAFLKEHAYPVIREAVEFFIGYIFEDPKTGYLTCGPSISPENRFVVDRQAFSASIGATYEIVMIRELFQIFVKAAACLAYEDELVGRVKLALERLLPFRIGTSRELMEWSHAYEAEDPQHRHTSHLLALYPFSQISPDTTPELAEAARISIKLRMTPEENWEDTGWARSMLMLYAARLRDSEAAHEHILSMERHLANDNLMVKHPPTRGAPSFADVYELDGNTGLTACVAEMLLQSHHEEVHLLPALPVSWHTGFVKGLRARGGYTVDISWKNGALEAAVIYCLYSACCQVRYRDKRVNLFVQAGRKYILDGSLGVQAT